MILYGRVGTDTHVNLNARFLALCMGGALFPALFQVQFPAVDRQQLSAVGEQQLSAVGWC